MPCNSYELPLEWGGKPGLLGQIVVQLLPTGSGAAFLSHLSPERERKAREDLLEFHVVVETQICLVKHWPIFSMAMPQVQRPALPKKKTKNKNTKDKKYMGSREARSSQLVLLMLLQSL